MHKMLLLSLLLFANNINALIISTVFGEVNEQNPAIIELVHSKAMQRLKHIDQSGPESYFTPNFPTFSRYDHSIGVYALLKRYNLSTEEQIAGLLHDASHTVFSHLADILFQNDTQRDESYQDRIHNWFLGKMGITEIISAYNLDIKDISPKNSKFTALEQPYPDMNADRIEYNLHTALVFNDLDASDVSKILDSLNFVNNKWYFTDLTNAKKFAKLSTYYTQGFWGHSHNAALYTASSAALKYAMQQNIISFDEMHFGIDQNVVTKLCDSTDPVLQKLVAIMKNIDAYYVNAGVDDFDVQQPIKMRGIDPLVMQDGKLQRLSELCIIFKNELQVTKALTKQGVRIKFINVKDAKVLELLRTANV